MTAKNLSVRLFLCTALLTIFAHASFSLATEITRYATADAYVMPNPDGCYGTGVELDVSTSAEILGFVKFDLSDIPSGVAINSAKLRLWCSFAISPGAIYILRASGTWSESGSNCVKWSTKPGWEIPIITGSTPVSNAYLEISVKDILKKWISDGQTNYGFYLVLESGAAVFAAHEFTGTSKDPRLVVDYTPGTCSASGQITDILGQGIQSVVLQFSRVSGSGTVPENAVGNVLGNWSQSGFVEGATYRVTPFRSQCGSRWTFQPTSRDFDCSSASNLNFRGTPPCPSAPPNVTAQPGPEPGQIVLHWDHACGTDFYVIRYDDDAIVPPWDPSPDGSPGSGSSVGYTTEVTISGLTPCQEYRLEVVGYNSCSEGEWSNPVFAIATCSVNFSLVPPLLGARSMHVESELNGVGIRVRGSVPSTNSPSTGVLHHQSYVCAFIVGESAFWVEDWIKHDFTVPQTGNYNIRVRGGINGWLRAGGTQGIHDCKHWLALVAKVSDNSGQVAVRTNELHSTLDEPITWGLSWLAGEAAKAIIKALFPEDIYVAATLNAVAVVDAIDDLEAWAEPFKVFSNQPVGSDDLLLTGRLEAGKQYEIQLGLVGATITGVSSFPPLYNGMSASGIDISASISEIQFEMTSGQFAGPMMEVSPISMAVLPSAEAGQVVELPNAFTIRNGGDQPLAGTIQIESGPFWLTGSSNFALQPLQSTTVSVSGTSSTPGSFTKKVSFVAGTTLERRVQCYFADPIPQITVYPTDTVRFGTLDLDSGSHISKNSAFVVGNGAGGILQGEITISPPFSVQGSGTFQVSAGETQEIDVTFTPADTGTFYGSINFTSGGNVIACNLVARAVHTQTGIREEVSHEMPREFWVSQNYPNPFNSGTEISFWLPRPVSVDIGVYNVTGQIVSRLYSGHLMQGRYSVTFDGSDTQGQPLPSGVYFMRFTTNENQQVRKLVILK
ncbi:MAG: DNRLRE domain-containing protein [candidate division Zixibacteria bacterium]|nr:DNRLRE domain-containing protein [candidate division Zixibacteria bacterium]